MTVKLVFIWFEVDAPKKKKDACSRIYTGIDVPKSVNKLKWLKKYSKLN